MRRPRRSSHTIYLYDINYNFLDLSFPTRSDAARVLQVNKNTFFKYLKNGKIHLGQIYSTIAPVQNSSGDYVLPMKGRITYDSLQRIGPGRTGSPVLVMCMETEIYFSSIHRARSAIKLGEI